MMKKRKFYYQYQYVTLLYACSATVLKIHYELLHIVVLLTTWWGCIKGNIRDKFVDNICTIVSIALCCFYRSATTTTLPGSEQGTAVGCTNDSQLRANLLGVSGDTPAFSQQSYGPT